MATRARFITSPSLLVFLIGVTVAVCLDPSPPAVMPNAHHYPDHHRRRNSSAASVPIPADNPADSPHPARVVLRQMKVRRSNQFGIITPADVALLGLANKRRLLKKVIKMRKNQEEQPPERKREKIICLHSDDEQQQHKCYFYASNMELDQSPPLDSNQIGAPASVDSDLLETEESTASRLFNRYMPPLMMPPGVATTALFKRIGGTGTTTSSTTTEPPTTPSPAAFESLDRATDESDSENAIDNATQHSEQPYLNVYEYPEQPQPPPEPTEPEKTEPNRTSDDDFYQLVDANGEEIEPLVESELVESSGPRTERDSTDGQSTSVPETSDEMWSNSSTATTAATTTTTTSTTTTTTTTTPAPGRSRIPKLLLPKVNRPAMYSLNGYVPKPSLQRHPAAAAAVDSTKKTRSSRNQRRKSKKSRRRSKSNVKNDRTHLPRQPEQAGEDYDDEYDEQEASWRRRDTIETSETITSRTAAYNSLGKSLARRKPSFSSSSSPLVTAVAAGAPKASLSSIPKTSFDCAERRHDGVYADPETGCQVWHICQNGQMHSFLCPQGTVFNSKNGVCDWWYNSVCQL